MLRYLIILIVLFCSLLSRGQNPSTITFPNPYPNPQNLAPPSYSRAVQKINLQPGFLYGENAGALNLLNLSLGSYPPNVSDDYLDTIPANNPVTFNPSLPVGTTDGYGSINAIGAFDYQFPVYVSPGKSGVQPNLSIAYNSNSSMSNVGLGFNISGISCITRSSKVFYYDGGTKPINLDNSDVFSLDGNRLLLKSGVYGQAGATYKTEIENYYRIISQGNNGNGPLSFVIYTPEGKTLEYGNSQDSKLTSANNGQVLSWYITKVTDEFGNFMQFYYINQNGEVNIDRIEYTGNINEQLAPYNKVQFQYIDRSDKRKLFYGGGEFNQTKLLKSITCFGNNEFVKKYVFDYQYNNASLLSKITEIDASNTQLNPTYIDWTKTNLITGNNGAFNVDNSVDLAEPTIGTNTVSINGFPVQYTFETTNGSNLAAIEADLNGDGKKDLVSINCKQGPVLGYIINPPPTLPTTFDVYLSITSQNQNQQNDFQKVTNPNLFNTQQLSSNIILATNVFDEDDDNIDEIFITEQVGVDYIIEKLKFNGTSYNLSLYYGPKVIFTNNYFVSSWFFGSLGFPGRTSRYATKSSFLITKSDVTGDNLLDQVIVDQEEVRVSPSNGQATVTYPISNVIKAKLGDFNGDGVNEIFLLFSNDLNCALNGTVLSQFTVTVLGYNSGNNSLNVLDTKAIFPNITTVIQNCGDIMLTKHFEIASGSIDFADFNGDGKTDILYNAFNAQYFMGNNPGSAKLRVSYSNGAAFQPDLDIINVLTKINNYDASFFAADLNNDGRIDWNSTAFDFNNFINMFNVYEGNGSIISSTPISYSKSTKYASVLGDFDGNGSVDCLSLPDFNVPASIEYNVFNRNTKQFVNHIFNIKNDYRTEYSILVNNKSTNNYPLYQKSNSNNPNVFSITRIPIYVVVKSNLNDIEKKYAYENALFHRQAKGFLGFEKVYSLDVISNFLSKNSYTYDAASDIVVNSDGITGIANPGNQNSFLSVNSNSISARSKIDLTYVITGNSRFLSSSTTVKKDYLKSVDDNILITYDNTKDGKVQSKMEFSTPWNAQSHMVENSQSFIYIAELNPFSNQQYYKPSQMTVTKSNNTNNPLTSSFITNFTYDGSGHLLTKIENSNIPNLAVTTTYQGYNNFGDPSQLSISAPDLAQPRSTQMMYDPTGRFIIKTTNAIGNFEECVYETKYGNKVQNKDITGLIKTMQYDGMGRLVKVIGTNNAINTIKYEWYGYNPINNNNITRFGAKITTMNQGSPTVIKKYDINDNETEIVQDVFGGGSRITEITYNTINQATSRTELATLNPGSGNRDLIISYDAFLRPSTIQQKIANNNLTSVTYSYNAISTDANYQVGFSQVMAPNSNAGQFNFVRKENNEAGENNRTINFTSFNPNAQNICNIKFNEFGSPYEMANTFAGGNPIISSIGYDALGRRQQVNDPSSGTSTFQYSSIGELLQQTTPNGSYTFGYDVLGRIVIKSSNNNTYNYQYISSGNGKQKLYRIVGPNETTEYKYDNLNRVVEKKQTAIDNKVFQTDYTYDQFGRIVNYIYPNGFTTTNEYDAIGTLVKIKNNNTNIWQLNSLYTPDLIEQYTYGNGLVNQIVYDASQNLQQMTYGNVEQQNYAFSPQNSDLLTRGLLNFPSNTNNNEQFLYDDFDRLVTTKYIDNANTLQVKATVSYNQNGNIASKSDAGSYVYGQNNSPYRLTGINNPVGNISLNTLNITYNDFQKVNQISEANTNKQFNFTYGNDEQRIKMEYKVNGANVYSRYYTDNYDREESGNSYREWDYIYAPSGLAAVYYKANGVGRLFYVGTDNLGSVTHLTDGNGSAVEEYSFDSWGRRRNPSDWNDYLNIPQSQYMIRGFTMHEHLNEVNMVNMNGRIYDPVLGRFLQPDEQLTDASDLQTFNMYSYCKNNPNKFTDPTGYDEYPAYTETYDQMFNNTNYLDSWYGQVSAGIYYANNPEYYATDYVSPNYPQFSTLGAATTIGGESYDVNFNMGEVKEYQNIYIGRASIVQGEDGYLTMTEYPDRLDWSTVGENLFHLTYPGGDNPMTYGGKYSYAYTPEYLSEYPAIGHDRRYDNLGIAGASGLFMDTRAIGADWRFVAEELAITAFPNASFLDKVYAGTLGTFLGVAALTKTVYQFTTPFGVSEVEYWYSVSDQGVTNRPDIKKH
jgi:RHS repeat-associated protein